MAKKNVSSSQPSSPSASSFSHKSLTVVRKDFSSLTAKDGPTLSPTSPGSSSGIQKRSFSSLLKPPTARSEETPLSAIPHSPETPLSATHASACLPMPTSKRGRKHASRIKHREGSSTVQKSPSQFLRPSSSFRKYPILRLRRYRRAPAKMEKKAEKDGGGRSRLSGGRVGKEEISLMPPSCTGNGKHPLRKIASSPWCVMEGGETHSSVPPSCGPVTTKSDDVEDVLRQTVPMEDGFSPVTSCRVSHSSSSFPVETKPNSPIACAPQNTAQEGRMKEIQPPSPPFLLGNGAPDAKDEERCPKGGSVSSKTSREAASPPAPRRWRKRKQRRERNLEKKLREFGGPNPSWGKPPLPVGNTTHTDRRGPPFPSAAGTREESHLLGVGRFSCTSAFPQGSGTGEPSMHACFSNATPLAYTSPLPSSYSMLSFPTPFSVPTTAVYGVSSSYAIATPLSSPRQGPPFFMDAPDEGGTDHRRAACRQGRKRISLPRGSGGTGTQRRMAPGEFLPDFTQPPFACAGFSSCGYPNASCPHSVMFSSENRIPMDNAFHAPQMDDIFSVSAAGDSHGVATRGNGPAMPPSTDRISADPLESLSTGMVGSFSETRKDLYASTPTTSPCFSPSASCVLAGSTNASPLSSPLYRFASPFTVTPLRAAAAPTEEKNGLSVEEKHPQSPPQACDTRNSDAVAHRSSPTDTSEGVPEHVEGGGGDGSLDAAEGLDAETRFSSMSPSFCGAPASIPLLSTSAPFFPSSGLERTGGYDGEGGACMRGRTVEEITPFHTASPPFPPPFPYACPNASFVPLQDNASLLRGVPPPSFFSSHPLHVDPSEARLEGRLPAASTDSHESSVHSLSFFSCPSTPPYGALEGNGKWEALTQCKKNDKGSGRHTPSCSEDTLTDPHSPPPAFECSDATGRKDDPATAMPSTALSASGTSRPTSSGSHHGSTHEGVSCSAAAPPANTWSVMEHPFPEHPSSSSSSSSLFLSNATQSHQTAKPSFAVHSFTPSSYSTPLSLPSVSDFPFRSFSLDPTNRAPVPVFSCSPVGSRRRSSGHSTHPYHTEQDRFASESVPTGSLFSSPSAMYSNLTPFCMPNYSPLMATRSCVPYKCAPTQIRLINTMKELTDLCRMLLDHPQSISLDLEGRDLGRNGSICIVVLATANCTHLIDMVVLGSSALDAYPSESGQTDDVLASHPHGTASNSTPNGTMGGSYHLLRQVLESPYILKLMLDCRRDCKALYYGYRIRLRNVCDLQAAYCCAFRPAYKHLPSMQAVLTHLDLLSAAEKSIIIRGKNCFCPEKGGSFQAWEERPLPPLLIHYCAVDVRHLFRVFYILKNYVDYAISVSEEQIERVCNGYDFKKMTVRDF